MELYVSPDGIPEQGRHNTGGIVWFIPARSQRFVSVYTGGGSTLLSRQFK